MERDICYRQEAGFAWCAVSWYPAVAKGVGTRAEATDAMEYLKKKEYEEYYGKESAFSKISKGLGSLFKK